MKENLNPICATCDGRGCPTCDIRNELRTIDTAPRDGTHILLVDLTVGSTGFGWVNGIHQPSCEVCHWFDDGFYSSNFGVDQAEAWEKYTHWIPLPVNVFETESHCGDSLVIENTVLTTEMIDRAIEAWFDSKHLEFGDYQKFRYRMESAISAALSTAKGERDGCE